ncbi:MAG: YihY/virulence factor BrkB family protein [Bryobacterales bacterium]|nr:YihY/virulence factor BrkB family protein [Bryobacterales bacterium]
MPDGPWARIIRYWQPSVHYCLDIEVHVYALAIAASALLSFFPFLIVMVSFAKYVLNWPLAVKTIYLALWDFFPGEMGDFIERNLSVTVNSRGPVQLTSLALLLFTANGVFEPMEVALNRVWGIRKNRSYFKNQLVSLATIFTCGGLALSSFMLTALNRQLVEGWGQTLSTWMTLLFFKAAALPLIILALFLVYWLLPNGRIPWRAVLPQAILVGIALEILKYLVLLGWPFLASKLRNEYGPFFISVTIVLWSFVAALIVLTGAEWAARRSKLAAESLEEH